MDEWIGLVITGLGAAIAVGAERQKRVELSDKHAALAAETRGRLAATDVVIEGLKTKIATLETTTAVTATKLDAMANAVDRIEKAIEGLRALLVPPAAPR